MVSGVGTRMDASALARLSPRAGAAGLLLGRDTERNPVLVPVLRPEPTRVVLIGGAWLTRIVVFRCLALGALVLVRTAEPRRWDGLGAAAANAPGRVTVVPGPASVVGHAGEPVLHVADLGGPTGGDLAPDATWQTLLTVADQLTEPVAAALPGADHVLVQRMWMQQATYVASALRVDVAAAQAAAALPDDAALLFGGGRYRQLWLGPTALEQRLFGPPQRV
jgi:hypothetical protein